jgi:predicted hydrocarbon binding protein
LQYDYPKIFPLLQKLEQSVVDAARESSLLLAGQQTGAWVFGRDYAVKTKLGLDEAIKHIGVHALGAVVEVEYKGEGLHIRNSPLCAPGHSGCKFFSGYLEGLLGPAVSSESLSIFEVCCRSYGADECVLAISD